MLHGVGHKFLKGHSEGKAMRGGKRAESLGGEYGVRHRLR